MAKASTAGNSSLRPMARTISCSSVRHVSFLIGLYLVHSSHGVVLVDPPIPTLPGSCAVHHQPNSVNYSTSILHASTIVWLARSNQDSNLDRVVRVLDDGSIKLKNAGVVSLEGVKLPKNQGFPNCLYVTPASKLSQLLPAKTIVRVESSSNSVVTLIRDSDNVIVNDRIIELGYAKASSKARASLKALEAAARENERGIFQSCTGAFQAKFDPLRAPVEPPVPRNPGDRVGCSDFTFYEDALKYYETYFDLYGDVARLDRNGDGVPCPGLPHTVNAELYRIKKPTR